MNKRNRKKQTRKLCKLGTFVCCSSHQPQRQTKAYNQLFKNCPIDKYPIIETLAYTDISFRKIDTPTKLEQMFTEIDKLFKSRKVSRIRKYLHAQSLPTLLINTLIGMKLGEPKIKQLEKEDHHE